MLVWIFFHAILIFKRKLLFGFFFCFFVQQTFHFANCCCFLSNEVLRAKPFWCCSFGFDAFFSYLFKIYAIKIFHRLDFFFLKPEEKQQPIKIEIIS
jgi:hypothetical protein